MVLKVLIYYSIKINKNWRSEMTCPKARRGKLRLTRVCNSLHTSPSMGYLLRHDVHLCEYAGTGLSLKWCFNEFLNPAIPVTATERTPKTWTGLTSMLTLISVWIPPKAKLKRRIWVQEVYLKGDCRKHKWEIVECKRGRGGKPKSWFLWCTAVAQSCWGLSETLWNLTNVLQEDGANVGVYVPTDFNMAMMRLLLSGVRSLTPGLLWNSAVTLLGTLWAAASEFTGRGVWNGPSTAHVTPWETRSR